LPRALGEVFFATPQAHDVTKGLLKGGAKLELRVLVSEAESVRATSTDAQPLLETSDQALSVTDVRAFSEGKLDAALSASRRGTLVLAVARQLAAPAPGAHPARVIIAGASNLAQNRSFRDSGLYGDRMLVENAISWLAARPALVSVPERTAHPIGLSLSEDSLGEILRYVVFYMPGSAALLGFAVMLRRRSVEKRSRRAAEDRKGDDEARA
jgi:hypothetical protein